MIVTTTNRVQPSPATVLHVAGELDTCAAERLREHLRRLPLGTDAVVLDLSAVSFMSVTALSVLVEARARLGPRLVLGERSRIVTRLLELTRLTSTFAQWTETGARAWTFSRADVDLVRGLLMAIHGCDAEQAWRMLVLAAARHGVPVRELAHLLIRAHGEAPSSAAAEAVLTGLMRTPPDGEADDPGPEGSDVGEGPSRGAARPVLRLATT